MSRGLRLRCSTPKYLISKRTSNDWFYWFFFLSSGDVSYCVREYRIASIALLGSYCLVYVNRFSFLSANWAYYNRHEGINFRFQNDIDQIPQIPFYYILITIQASHDSFSFSALHKRTMYINWTILLVWRQAGYGIGSYFFYIMNRWIEIFNKNCFVWNYLFVWWHKKHNR